MTIISQKQTNKKKREKKKERKKIVCCKTTCVMAAYIICSKSPKPDEAPRVLPLVSTCTLGSHRPTWTSGALQSSEYNTINPLARLRTPLPHTVRRFQKAKVEKTCRPHLLKPGPTMNLRQPQDNVIPLVRH